MAKIEVPYRLYAEPGKLYDRDHPKVVLKDNLPYRLDLTPGTGRISEYDNGSILAFVCPCGCGMLNFISIWKQRQQQHGWEWNGNREKPTLKPSIQLMTGCKWHGHLINGIWNWSR